MALAPAWIYERLTKAGAKIHPKEDPCQLRKACKNTTERDGAVIAHIKDGAAVCRFLAWFDKEAPKGRLTELQAAEKSPNSAQKILCTAAKVSRLLPLREKCRSRSLPYLKRKQFSR